MYSSMTVTTWRSVVRRASMSFIAVKTSALITTNDEITQRVAKSIFSINKSNYAKYLSYNFKQFQVHSELKMVRLSNKKYPKMNRSSAYNRNIDMLFELKNFTQRGWTTTCNIECFLARTREKNEEREKGKRGGGANKDNKTGQNDL